VTTAACSRFPDRAANLPVTAGTDSFAGEQTDRAQQGMLRASAASSRHRDHGSGRRHNLGIQYIK
jgi:hypothetical protein